MSVFLTRNFLFIAEISSLCFLTVTCLRQRGNRFGIAIGFSRSVLGLFSCFQSTVVSVMKEVAVCGIVFILPPVSLIVCGVFPLSYLWRLIDFSFREKKQTVTSCSFVFWSGGCRGGNTSPLHA